MESLISPVQPARHEKGDDRDEESLDQPEGRKPGSKGQGHKRTKTGCLTCRKRRIKCGEERPACQNCVKSKRQCAGYNQRVVFKDPINVYRGPQGSSSQASGSEHTFRVGHGTQPQAARPPPIAPKPANSVEASDPTAPKSNTTTPAVSGQGVFTFQVDENNSPSSAAPSSSVSPPNEGPDSIDRPNLPVIKSGKSPQREVAYPGAGASEAPQQGSSSSPSTANERMDLGGWSDVPTTTLGQPFASRSSWAHTSGSSTSFQTSASPHDTYPAPISAPGLFPEVNLTAQQRYQAMQPWDRDQIPGYERAALGIPSNLRPVLAAGDRESDDPSDMDDDDYDSDDSFTIQAAQADSCTVDDELGVMATFQADQISQDMSLRSITSFINRPNMLSTYIPSHRSSPLNNSMTARIFSHFINVTAATISMFERHPANPSLIFEGNPIPRSQQNLWTYTIPAMALRNDGLLHAILALAALHIAKLQGDHITASLKHYSISLRRIGKSVSHPGRKNRLATLTAALVLALYECWCADHQKWSNHLLGARMLLKEIDFAPMTKFIKSVKLKQRQEEEAQNFPGMHQTFGGIHEDGSIYQRANEDVDENIVGMIMGKRVRYDQYGQIVDDEGVDVPGPKSYTYRQLQDYETQRDLFWWYCKMDAYHSIIGGGRLFMEYDRWSHCPPRAPLGRLSAAYGTYDHLMLIIGRVADFTAKDVKRKRLAWKANSERRPSQASKIPNQAGQRGPPPPQPPPFSGMMPDTGEPKLPMGFQESFGDQVPEKPQADLVDLEARRIEAEEEWHDIMNAFSLLEDHFGEDFQALGPEFSRPIETPFGPALQYRTYGIAGIWLNYYMALIVCHRAHPSMPPAAMMAAGMAAKQTAFFANEIGRIAAGIAPYSSTTSQVTPGVGAGLIETSFCLFIAGVQYQDHGHRMWTINRLQDIARLTGWETSNSVITGCEGSWTKLAELGRGPPYTRTTDQKPHVNMMDEEAHKGRRLDQALRSGDGKIVVHETERAHFALGLLGFEDDFDNMILENEEGKNEQASGTHT